MPIGKPKEPKEPKAPKEKKPKKPKKVKPPKDKKVKDGEAVPEEGEDGKPKKKKPPILLIIIPLVVIIAAAVVVFVFVLPNRNADEDPDASVSVEPSPPVLPEEIMIGETAIVGMALEADESGAVAEKAKTVTYTYSNLNDAGKAAQTYAKQLAGEEPRFSLVDEDLVRLREQPDYTAAEGTVLFARNVPIEEPAATQAPESQAPEDPKESEEGSQPPDAEGSQAPAESKEPEPEEEPITYVHTVRMTWSPGVCVVTADEKVGKVTSPPPTPPAHSISMWEAEENLEAMLPEQLGLPGESMDIYEVIPMDGTEMVNGAACIRMYVYSNSNVQNGNEFMGSYLMSLDGQHLYRLDPVTDEIIELEYPLK